MEGETYVIEGDTFAVFDPLGGLSAAHATAIAACAAFRRTARDCPADPRRALLDANEAILEAVEADPALRGVGCTAAALHVSATVATIAWAGDVHVLRLRGERLEALIREHSLENEAVRLGVVSTDEQARELRAQGVIVRALGMPEVDVDVTTERVDPGDLFVIMSNEVRAALGDTLLAALLFANRDDERACVRELLENAEANAARDWLTVVIVRANGPGRPGVSGATVDAAG